MIPRNPRLGLALASLAAFALVAVAVVLGWTSVVDAAVVRAAAVARRSTMLNTAALDITALGDVTLVGLVSIVAGISFWLAKKNGAALAVLVAPFLAGPVDTAVKLLFGRPRPAGGLYQIPGSFTFPSGHATSSAALYLTLGLLVAPLLPPGVARRFALGCALGLPALIAASRAYLGVHYLSDVVAGLFLGSALALATTTWAETYTAKSTPSVTSTNLG